MGNDPRWVPAEALVEVTCKVMQGLFLLRPSRDLNEIVNGILARAVARYEVAVCAYVVLSNHALCAAAHNASYVQHRVM